MTEKLDRLQQRTRQGELYVRLLQAMIRKKSEIAENFPSL